MSETLSTETHSPTPTKEAGASGRSRPNLAASRRLGLGPAYHGPLPEAIRLEHADRAATAPTDTGDEEAPTVEPVPDDVRNELRQAYGVDVSEVHRGPDAAEEARRLGARAFAQGGEMFVPAEAGPLASPEGKSIVAHELTHVAQQRRSGGLLPPEESRQGRRLEADAQQAERFFRGDPGAPRPSGPTSTDPGDDTEDDDTDWTEPDTGDANVVDDPQAFMRRLVAEGAAIPDGSGGIVFTPSRPPAPGSAPGVQRQTGPAPKGSTAADAPTSWNPLASFGHTVAADFTRLAQDTLVSEFGLSDDVQDDFNRGRNDSEREFATTQFETLRLEHRRAQVMAEHNGAQLGETEVATLKEEVDHEVKQRLDELANRVQIRLDAINDQRRLGPGGQQQRRTEVLDPDQYQHLLHRLFGDPDGDIPPDDADAVDAARRHAHAQQLATRATGAAGAATTTGATATGTTSAGTTPSGTTPATTGSGTATGGGTSAGAAGSRTQKQPEPGFRSWTDVEHSAVRDLVAVDTAFLGMEFTDEELFGKTASKEDSAAAAPGAGSTAGHPATTTAAAATHEATHTEGHLGPTGHETIDLDHLDLDDLSARIYGRLRSKLRLELLVDRERAGFLTDFR